MAITEAEADLAIVRRFEAAGARAWPCEHARYDRSWAVRLSPGLPARRLNSVNPLDPGDAERLEERIAVLEAEFAQAGRPLVFRLSPLASPELVAHLDVHGWEITRRSLVMRAPLAGMPAGEAGHVAQVDAETFAAGAVAIGNLDAKLEAPMVRHLRRIEPESGLFALTENGAVAAQAICVRDGDLAGLFEVVTAPSFRGRGFGRRVVQAACGWARGRGAVQGWLQVEAGNAPALGLYRSFGFADLYDYHYRPAPVARA